MTNNVVANQSAIGVRNTAATSQNRDSVAVTELSVSIKVQTVRDP